MFVIAYAYPPIFYERIKRVRPQAEHVTTVQYSYGIKLLTKADDGEFGKQIFKEKGVN